jgi:siroheme synthase
MTTVTTADVATEVFTWAKSEYKSAKLLVKMSSGTHSEIAEVLITLDTSDNVAITQYGTVFTSSTSLGEIDATVVDGDVIINVNAENANTVVTVFGTLIV